MRNEEADVLNGLWNWAVGRLRDGRGHPYYWCLAQDMFAYVRSYGRKIG